MSEKLIMPNFQAIPQFTQEGSYVVDVFWSFIERNLNLFFEMGLDLDPDFQRAHVWTEEKQMKYVEFILRGGKSGRDIYFNHTAWTSRLVDGVFVLVDGKQRLEAVRKFMRNDLPVFGYLRNEYSGTLSMRQGFRFHVNDLKTRAEVLQWYLEMNEGGVVHTKAELDKVKKLLEKEKPNAS